MALLASISLAACANDIGPRPGVRAATQGALSVPASARAAPDAGLQLAQGQSARIRVETGSHAAPLRAIAVSGDLVFTAADDKTARIWDRSSGALRHVLRPALGDADIGRMYALAAHPQRPLLAVAGTTAQSGGAHRILLFDTQTGAFERAFDAHGGNIKRMAWASGGALLLATYDGEHGLRAFDAGGARVFEDAYDAASYGLAVSPDGSRVASTSLDGWVRVYRVEGAGLVLLKRWRTDTPAPRDIAFSPDGGRLAVGYIGSARDPGAPTIFDASSGALQRQMLRPALKAGDLRSVAWSPDGRTLFAGGSAYATEGRHAVHGFEVANGREIFSTATARNSITDLQVGRDGAVLFSSFDGSWGRVRDRRFELQVGGDIADLRGPNALRMDARGRLLSFRFGLDRAPTVFDLDERVLRDERPGDRLQAPGTRGPGGDRWENVRQPIVNGRPIGLDKVEVSRSISYLRGGDALLGSSLALRRIDVSGRVLWRVPTNAEVWAVNVSADDRLALTALSDGTIRWWRTTDGMLLMSLFARPDGRWALWSPGGYFDASVRADQMIGWAVNRAQEPVADFFTLSRFREQFNRPDVIDRILDTANVALALEQADRARASELLAQAPASTGQATPSQAAPVQSASAQSASAQSASAQSASAQSASAQPVPSQASPGQGAPAQAAPSQSVSAAGPGPAAADAARAGTSVEKSPGPLAGTTPRPPSAELGFAAVNLGALRDKARRDAQAEEALRAAASPTSVPALDIPREQMFLPPVIQPAGPTKLAAAGGRVEIPFAVRAQSRPVVKVLVNGRPNPTAYIEPPAAFDGKSRGIARFDGISSAAVVQLIAADEHGASEPLSFRIEPAALSGSAASASVAPLSSMQGVVVVNPQSPDASTQAAAGRIAELGAVSGLSAPPQSGARSRLFVVAIGISRYRNPDYQLGLPAKDATDFMATVRSQEGRLYSSVQTRLLVNEQADRRATQEALAWLRESVGPEDTGILFIAGHGLNGPAGEYYFMPWDADVQALQKTGVPEAAFRRTLASARGRTVLFIDTCHAGAIGGSGASNRELRRFANDLAASENGVIVFASSSGRQLSEEDEAWGNGAFTKAVVEGLNGGADFRRTGVVTFKSLDYFVSEEVKRLTEGRQTPVTNIPVGVPDFALARLT
ncbi:MAG: caspase family protein [Burkholderiaceae bacterium]